MQLNAGQTAGGRCARMLLQMRPIDRKRPATGFEMFRAQTWAGRLSCLPNGDRAKRDVSSRGYAINCDAVVNDAIMLTYNSVYHHGLVKDSGDVFARQGGMPESVIAEIPYWDKSVATSGDPKIKTEPNGAPTASEPEAWSKASDWRQWRPAAIIIRISPRNPRRTPHPVRRPTPTQMAVAKPAAIMKRRPAPRVIREPIPTAVTINPMTAIAIRTPVRVHCDDRGLPAAAIAAHIDPVAVRSQGVVKVWLGLFSR